MSGRTPRHGVRRQRIPLALERDDADAAAIHAVARNRLGWAIGTGRLLAAGGGSGSDRAESIEHVGGGGHVGRIGRMAVRRELRGAGTGRLLLESLASAAGERGDGTVTLHAQASAVAFYRRAGFAPWGAPFEEAGILHQEMRRAT
jgi:predicted GNAT family N-acyltransferase